VYQELFETLEPADHCDGFIVGNSILLAGEHVGSLKYCRVCHDDLPRFIVLGFSFQP
jgi:hypothetical protein